MRAGNAQMVEATRLGSRGNDIGNMQPGQRAVRQDAWQRLMDRIIGTNKERGAGSRQLAGGVEHQRGHAVEVAPVQVGRSRV